MATHIQKWNSKSQELSGQPPPPLPSDEPITSISTRSFADLNRNACLLCLRSFKSEAEVRKHEELSDLHKSKLADEAAIAAADKRLNKGSVAQKSTETTSQPTDSSLMDPTSSEYRDRAQERRVTFNQPKRPNYSSGEFPRKKPPTSQVAAADPEPDPVAQMSKGTALMAAMGWSEGQGLGSTGSGRVEPIEAGMYEAGVGLGAGSTKVVGKDISAPGDDGTYGSFVKKVRDNARSRYDDLN